MQLKYLAIMESVPGCLIVQTVLNQQCSNKLISVTLLKLLLSFSDVPIEVSFFYMIFQTFIITLVEGDTLVDDVPRVKKFCTWTKCVITVHQPTQA